MNVAMTRREAIRTALMAGIAGPATLLFVGKARADSPFDCYTLGYEWDQYNRQPLLRQAMNLVNKRFTDPAIATNAHEQNGNYPFITPELVSATAQDAYPYAPDYSGILWRQLSALRNVQRKPNLYITADYRKHQPTVVAWALYDQVKIRFSNTRTTSSQAAAFHVVLNTYLLGSTNSPFSDPCFWASVIAHEMLHNLGHMHDDDITNPWYSWRQMITFQNAFHLNGQYKRGMKTPFICSGGTPTNYCGCTALIR